MRRGSRDAMSCGGGEVDSSTAEAPRRRPVGGHLLARPHRQRLPGFDLVQIDQFLGAVVTTDPCLLRAQLEQYGDGA
ncbi:hypothetical protein [Amycolatopsis palatopharyngis]|uniref:hypothetical protein n=1 Tax=Amycolatopsis palatopharyngis TaxID=187982 RepID=UPI0013BEA179|nr:hypothetical protein [Amycolatopsis palatopharyngis]